jgi:hypothetical protein
MDSAAKITDTTLEDVDTLLTSINGQMASIQLQPNPEPNTNTTARTSERPTGGLTQCADNTSIFPIGRFIDETFEHGDPPLPDFLGEHNVGEALMSANTLHMQRHGTHAVASLRFAPHVGDVGSISGRFAPFHGEGAPLSVYDFHPSLGHSGHGAFTVLPTPRELPQRFIPGQESASILQLAKRPKPRAKDVAHRRS